jgi:transcription elongation factor Elf1
MKLFSLSCQHCGAPLEVPAKVKQLTCQFCGTRLKVRQTGSAVYTEALDEITETTSRIAENTDTIKLQNELERIDREWSQEKENFMVRGKDGQLSVPSKTASLIGGIMVVGFGIVWTLFATGIAGVAASGFGGAGAIAGIFPCFGLLFIGLGAFVAIHNYSKAGDFELRQRQHHQRRQKVVDELSRERVDS